MDTPHGPRCACLYCRKCKPNPKPVKKLVAAFVGVALGLGLACANVIEVWDLPAPVMVWHSITISPPTGSLGIQDPRAQAVVRTPPTGHLELVGQPVIVR